LKYKIRKIDIDEYPSEGYDQLLSFIAGISAKDYDLTHIYIDSVFKVAKNDNLQDFALFLKKLDTFLSDSALVVTVVCSSDSATLPEEIQKYC
jgi:hypothetical protein